MKAKGIKMEPEWDDINFIKHFDVLIRYRVYVFSQ